jgi:guanylate kinase
MRPGHLFVLSAPSGAGKSTLIDRAIREVPGIWHSVSATTRQPREYEEEGVHYYFMEHGAFEKAIAEDHFLEWAEVHGEYYGTPSKEVDKRLAGGEDVIMDLDVQGALQVKKHRPEAILIFIMPPSLEALRKRIENRQTETEESIRRRLSIAEKEMSHRDQYEQVIVNDVLDDAFGELAGVIQSSRGSAEEAGS